LSQGKEIGDSLGFEVEEKIQIRSMSCRKTPGVWRNRIELQGRDGEVAQFGLRGEKRNETLRRSRTDWVKTSGSQGTMIG